MPKPQKLLNLCEGIRISRYKKDLVREEKLYFVLIDIFRSPEMLKIITTQSSKLYMNTNIGSKNVKKLDNRRKLTKKIGASRTNSFHSNNIP